MSYSDGYLCGCYVRNYCGLDKDYLCNVVPFKVEHNGDDEVAPPPVDMQKKAIRLSRYAKFMTKTANLTKVYQLNPMAYDNLVSTLTHNTYCYTTEHVMLHDKNPAINRYINKFIVKTVNVRNWRDVYTAQKELHMTSMIYNSSYMLRKGCDIVCKPFFGCLLWNGKQWKFVSIYEKANGITLDRIYKHRFFNARYDKVKILCNVAHAIKTMWLLGFAHNDLHDANIMYDLQTHTAKIIDFEMAVYLPDKTIQDMRSEPSDVIIMSRTYCEQSAKWFDKHMKQMALSLLYLAKDICYVNTDEDGAIYNTDDHFLPMFFDKM
jgi:serine/threonine protein kinase